MHARVGLMCEGNAGAYFEQFLLRLSRLAPQAARDVKPRLGMLPDPHTETYGNRFRLSAMPLDWLSPQAAEAFYGMISADIAASFIRGTLPRPSREDSLSRYQDQ
jgi:hypothetical protein